MSFIVRQIARTAEGREIIRPSAFDKDQLTVGRGTDSDIHLPDLAVTLHHVTIRLITAQRVAIDAIAGLPFDLDGRQVTTSAEADAARGATIRLGSHVLALSKGEGEEAGKVIISVERVGAVSDASEAKDEAKVFSLAGKIPGKRTAAWVLGIAVLALFLAWPIFSYMTANPGVDKARPIAFHADEMWSSGKLSLVHSSLQNNCQACHVNAFESVRDESCLTCHDTLHDHADPKRLLAAMPDKDAGGRFQRAVAGAFNVPEGSCAQCHSEHEGAKELPVTAERFCSDCHTGLNEKLNDTKILNASGFEGDKHPQFRPAVQTSSTPRPVIQRISLDARPLEDTGIKFPHAMHLSKTNGVARMAQTMQVEYGFGQSLVCADCHVTDPTRTRFAQITMEKNCQMCHSLSYDRIDGTVRTLRHGDPAQVIADLRAFYRSTGPVRPINFGGMRRRPGDYPAQQTASTFNFAAASRSMGAEAAIRGVFSDGGACFDCHKVLSPAESGTGTWGIVPVRIPDRYMNKGWFDHGSHETETCQSCHAAEQSNSASDVLLPKIASCQQCHGGEKSVKQVASSCAMCHDYHMDQTAPLMAKQGRFRAKAPIVPKSIAGNPAKPGA